MDEDELQRVGPLRALQNKERDSMETRLSRQVSLGKPRWRPGRSRSEVRCDLLRIFCWADGHGFAQRQHGAPRMGQNAVDCPVAGQVLQS